MVVLYLRPTRLRYLANIGLLIVVHLRKTCEVVGFQQEFGSTVHQFVVGGKSKAGGIVAQVGIFVPVDEIMIGAAFGIETSV